MITPNEEALICAKLMETLGHLREPRHIRRLVAENEALWATFVKAAQRLSTPNEDVLPTNERINRLTGENEALREHIRRLVAENEALRAQMALCEGTLESRDRNIEALTNGRHELQAQGKHPAPCARFCEAKAFEVEASGLKRQITEQAALIRKQGRELGEQDALLRQALEALEKTETGPGSLAFEREDEAIQAIRQHLEGKA